MKLKKLLKVLYDDEMIVINEWVPRGTCVRRDGDCEACEHYGGEEFGCAQGVDQAEMAEQFDGSAADVPHRLAGMKVIRVTARGECAYAPFEKLNDRLMIEVRRDRG